jgi:glycosyltransferase involved in cell wall biosynthesis
MNVCFVCSEYPPAVHGGIGAAVQAFARALVQRGHGVRVVGVYPGGPAGTKAERDEGVEIWRLPATPGRLGWIAGRARLFRQVRTWVRRREVDLVEVPDWEGWAAGWPALPVPVIAHLHGSATYFSGELGRPVRLVTRSLERRSLRRADFVSASSGYVARRTMQLFPLGAAPEVLHNGVELPPRDAREPSGEQVVFTGTLTPRKGVLQLLAAWPEVARERPLAELHLYGKDSRDGEAGSMRARLCASLPPALRRSVTFHGHVPRAQILQALATARMAVFPSQAEAFALAPLEAMAAGCPTIASRCGAGPELADDGVHALLVDPDSPREIAGAILRLFADPAIAASLGEAGRRRVDERFSLAGSVTRREGFAERCRAAFAGPGAAHGSAAIPEAP